MSVVLPGHEVEGSAGDVVEYREAGDGNDPYRIRLHFMWSAIAIETGKRPPDGGHHQGSRRIKEVEKCI